MKSVLPEDMPGIDRFTGSKGGRIHYGAEFCPRLLPPLSELIKAYKSSREKELGFTFVSPPVTDNGIKKLDSLFAFLSSQDDAVEVAINDWGVLRLLRRKYPNLRPVLGRLMNKMLRDPRVTPQCNADSTPGESLHVLQQAGINSPYYLQFIKSFGIEKIELDNLYQGINVDFISLGIKPSIYIPWGYITTGRLCFFGSLNQPQSHKFATNVPCQKECKDQFAYLTDTNNAFSGGKSEFIQMGNTVFYQQDEVLIEKAFIWAKKHRARIICQLSPLGGIAYSTENIDLARAWLRAYPKTSTS